jgi:hypothetical protein
MTSEPCRYGEVTDGTWSPCGSAACHEAVTCTAGCGDVFAYCAGHGGEKHARRMHDEHLLTCWHALAPATVPRDEIELRGTMLTDSEHHVGVVRATGGGRYGAAVGLGSHTQPLPGSFPTPAAAEAAAREAVAAGYRTRVEEITTSRGGTLAWGLALAPPNTTILFCPPGVSAWEAMGQRDEMVSVEEAARKLGVSDETVRRRIREGLFPGARQDQVPGGWRWMIPAGEIPAVLPSTPRGAMRRGEA